MLIYTCVYACKSNMYILCVCVCVCVCVRVYARECYVCGVGGVRAIMQVFM